MAITNGKPGMKAEVEQLMTEGVSERGAILHLAAALDEFVRDRKEKNGLVIALVVQGMGTAGIVIVALIGRI